MIISKKYKYVFISTPKTGSHTMFKILEKQYNGFRYGLKENGHFHEWKTPNNFKNYFHFSTVRNPYERFVSLWYSLLIIGKNKNKVIPGKYRESYKKVIGSDKILDFAKFLTENKNKIENNSTLRLPLLCIPQYRWYTEYLPKNTKFLKMENLENEINSLPFIDKKVEMLHLLKRKHKGWDYYKNPELLEYVNEWASGDFEIFEYVKH